MAKVNRITFLLAVMGVWVLMVTIVGSIFHIGKLFVFAAALSLLLVMSYIWRRSGTTRPNSKAFWAVLDGSLIFFAGALYGLSQSLGEGWRWRDLLYLIFPLAMGSYLLWFALKIRKTSM